MPIDLSHQAAYEPRADAYAELLEPTLRGAAEKLAELAGAGPHMRLLDVATGTRSAARAAAAKGATVAAVDLSPAMVEVARRGSPASIEFRVADVHELPYSDDAFDAVVCGLALSQEVTRAPRKRLSFLPRWRS